MLIIKAAKGLAGGTCRAIQLDGAQVGGEKGSCMADVGVCPKAQPIVLPNRQHGMVSRLQIVLVQAQHLLQLLDALRHHLRPQYQLLELFHCGRVSNVSSLGLHSSEFWLCPQIAPSLQVIIVQAQHLLQLFCALRQLLLPIELAPWALSLQWGLDVSTLERTVFSHV